MTRTFAVALTALAAIAVHPALAADPKVEAGLKSIAAVEADASKLSTFCEMMKTMEAAQSNEDDDTKNAEVDKKIDGYMQTLGSDFAAAWDLDVSPETADGKALEEAMDKLANKCPS